MQSGDGERVLEVSIGTGELAYGDTVICHMAGGGGYGDPLERDPELVQQDVIAGLVSVDSARDDYGVVFKPDQGYAIDLVATDALRSEQSGR